LDSEIYPSLVFPAVLAGGKPLTTLAVRCQLSTLFTTPFLLCFESLRVLAGSTCNQRPTGMLFTSCSGGSTGLGMTCIQI
jgi:hypothetical protein